MVSYQSNPHTVPASAIYFHRFAHSKEILPDVPKRGEQLEERAACNLCTGFGNWPAQCGEINTETAHQADYKHKQGMILVNSTRLGNTKILSFQ